MNVRYYKANSKPLTPEEGVKQAKSLAHEALLRGVLDRTIKQKEKASAATDAPLVVYSTSTPPF